jgi:general secretion pathway protein K
MMVIIVLIALMAMIAADQRASMKQTQLTLNRRRSDVAVKSAMAFALGAIQQGNTNLVTQNDAWAQLDGDDDYTLDGDTSFRVQVVDCGSLINVNTASATWLQQLPLSTDQVDCLMDWRETGLQPRSDGAKDTYYNGLTQPYNTKLGALSTVDELLLVKDWTGDLLYQPITNAQQSSAPLPVDTNGNTLPLAAIFTVDSGSPNTQASGAARTNLSVRSANLANTLRRAGISPGDANRIAAGAPYNSFAALFRRGGISQADLAILLNIATFSGTSRATGKINVNTATQAVLLTIPNMTQPTAETIVNQQSTGFSTLGQLATTANLTQANLSQFADYFTVGGDTWLVRAYGESHGTGEAVEAIIRLSNATPAVITWEKINSAGVPKWWGWNDTASNSDDANTITNTATSTTVSGGAQ